MNLISPTEYADLLAERARRAGYRDVCVTAYDPPVPHGRGTHFLSRYAGLPTVNIGDYTRLVVLGSEVVVLGPDLDDRDWAEISGRAGTERLLRAVSLWGFGAGVRAQSEVEP